MPPLTALIGQSAEAGLPLGNSCKLDPSPPPPCLPPSLARAGSVSLPPTKWVHNFSLLARKHAPRVSAAEGGSGWRCALRGSARSPRSAQHRGKRAGACQKDAEGVPESFLSLQAHLSCGAGVLLKSFSVTHSCFPWEGEGRMAKGCAWAAYLLVIPNSLLRTEPGVCKPLPCTPGDRAERPGVVVLWVERVPNSPGLLLLWEDEVRESGGAAPGRRCEKERPSLGNKGRHCEVFSMHPGHQNARNSAAPIKSVAPSSPPTNSAHLEKGPLWGRASATGRDPELGGPSSCLLISEANAQKYSATVIIF